MVLAWRFVQLYPLSNRECAPPSIIKLPAEHILNPSSNSHKKADGKFELKLITKES